METQPGLAPGTRTLPLSDAVLRLTGFHGGRVRSCRAWERNSTLPASSRSFAMATDTSPLTTSLRSRPVPLFDSFWSKQILLQLGVVALWSLFCVPNDVQTEWVYSDTRMGRETASSLLATRG